MTFPPAEPARVLWITPELHGGIASYSRMLWPAVAEAARVEGGFQLLAPVQTSPETRDEAIAAAGDLRPDLVHVQHEYLLFGGKNPWRDRLPRWMRRLRAVLPAATRVVATAHGIVPEDYRFDIRVQGWRGPVHRVANATVLPWLRRRWSEGTWALFDGVVVHSSLQAAMLAAAGHRRVATIPLFVPESRVVGRERPPSSTPRVTVFGYFCPEKGQDVAIRAVRHVRCPMILRLAGGVGHPMNEAYFTGCDRAIAELGLRDRVEVTGYVPEAEVPRVFAESDLVMAPFRSTSGSASLAQAFAHRAAVLASDLPLNREVADRVPDSLALFASEDPVDCARRIDALLGDADALRRLRHGAGRYAAAHSAQVSARRHLDFYRGLLAGTFLGG